MVYSKKKQTFLFSDGSIVHNKILNRTVNKIQNFNKDHLTFVLNKKIITSNSNSKNYLSFGNTKFWFEPSLSFNV